MKGIFIFSLIVILAFSCGKKGEGTEGTEEGGMDQFEYLRSNPITIEYSNPINGYKVTAVWTIKDNQATFGGRLFGPAVLTFTEVKTGKKHIVNQLSFTEEISKENADYINYTDDEGEKEYLTNRRFKQVDAYKLPALTSVDISADHKSTELSKYIPFFFKDVDFDSVDELILVGGELSERGVYLNQVFKVDGGFTAMTAAPFKSFENFYMKAAGASGNFNKTEIDYATKTITQRWKTGEVTSGEAISKYDEITKKVEFVSKWETENDLESNGLIKILFDKNGKRLTTNGR